MTAGWARREAPPIRAHGRWRPLVLVCDDRRLRLADALSKRDSAECGRDADRHRAPNGSACNPKTCTSALWDGARERRRSNPAKEGADTRCGSRGCRSASRSQDFFSGDSPIDYRGLGWSRISRAADCAARVRTLIASQRYRADPCAKRRHVHASTAFPGAAAGLPCHGASGSIRRAASTRAYHVLSLAQHIQPSFRLLLAQRPVRRVEHSVQPSRPPASHPGPDAVRHLLAPSAGSTGRPLSSVSTASDVAIVSGDF